MTASNPSICRARDGRCSVVPAISCQFPRPKTSYLTLPMGAGHTQSNVAARLHRTLVVAHFITRWADGLVLSAI
jgi:hypothetical protein